jgi:ectoine hydroxylase-related dioxygenase (phytanoyl-CoA dioxygenase family)
MRQIACDNRRSHKRSELAGAYLGAHHADGIGQPEGAIPVLCPANSALIFDRRLYHTAAPNWSETIRKAFFVGYGFRWLRPMDPMGAIQPCIGFG